MSCILRTIEPFATLFAGFKDAGRFESMQNVCGSAILSPTDSLALILCVLLYYYHTSAKKEDMCNSVTWNAKGGGG